MKSINYLLINRHIDIFNLAAMSKGCPSKFVLTEQFFCRHRKCVPSLTFTNICFPFISFYFFFSTPKYFKRISAQLKTLTSTFRCPQIYSTNRNFVFSLFQGVCCCCCCCSCCCCRSILFTRYFYNWVLVVLSLSILSFIQFSHSNGHQILTKRYIVHFIWNETCSTS